MATCCQYAPNGQDYWCASPSANAVASAMAEVLVTASADFGSPEHSKIQGIHPALYQRVGDLDARVRSVCAKVSRGCCGSAGVVHGWWGVGGQ